MYCPITACFQRAMMATMTALFAQHSRLWRDFRYVYPVISRRSKGLSIGINLNPGKACNFDCIYCSVKRTTRPQNRRVRIDEVRAELDEMLALVRHGEIFQQP